jgi:intracellular septation protein A
LNFWTYRRSCEIEGRQLRVEATVGSHVFASTLYVDNTPVDRQEMPYSAGLRNLLHTLPADLGGPAAATGPLTVEVGYFSWWNVGIWVNRGALLLHASHPEADRHFVRNSRLLNAIPTQNPEVAREHAERWQRNKYSIYADVALGALFFAVGKLTGDLTLAALIGAAAGLALVLMQRYVTVDLLGGFAVFGTVMLVVSAVFSLLFQSEMMVQMKSTILGLLTAALFLGDGLLRGGQYFGGRMQRYMPAPISARRMATGMGLLGLVMAGLNYAVAQWMSEDFWLTYTTFLDMPITILLVYAVYFWARRGAGDVAPS